MAKYKRWQILLYIGGQCFYVGEIDYFNVEGLDKPVTTPTKE